jgi:hypothetical protein
LARLEDIAVQTVSANVTECLNHFTVGQGVVGSNPAIPTNICRDERPGGKPALSFFGPLMYGGRDARGRSFSRLQEI